METRQRPTASSRSFAKRVPVPGAANRTGEVERAVMLADIQPSILAAFLAVGVRSGRVVALRDVDVLERCIHEVVSLSSSAVEEDATRSGRCDETAVQDIRRAACATVA